MKFLTKVGYVSKMRAGMEVMSWEDSGVARKMTQMVTVVFVSSCGRALLTLPGEFGK